MIFPFNRQTVGIYGTEGRIHRSASTRRMTFFPAFILITYRDFY